MFSENTDIMLYAKDLKTEYEFWAAIGFVVEPIETEALPHFQMKTNEDATLNFTVYAKENIQKNHS